MRAAAERAKPNGERLREYTDARLPLLEKNMLDAQPVYPELEQLQLEFWLTKLREYLTADAPETQLYLGQDSPETLARTLSASKLGRCRRPQAAVGGRIARHQGVERSDDPLCAEDRRVRARRAQSL